ncbi:hypothetical protein SKA58_18227 [Sphingomonas sp. SKA58]|nr:hypothetical protein SKA58_18227 [Sphingomonas sp. SKA58]
MTAFAALAPVAARQLARIIRAGPAEPYSAKWMAVLGDGD